MPCIVHLQFDVRRTGSYVQQCSYSVAIPYAAIFLRLRRNANSELYFSYSLDGLLWRELAHLRTTCSLTRIAVSIAGGLTAWVDWIRASAG